MVARAQRDGAALMSQQYSKVKRNISISISQYETAALLRARIVCTGGNRPLESSPVWVSWYKTLHASEHSTAPQRLCVLVTLRYI